LSQKIPQHLAIIMDGNGRWAEGRGLSRSAGHEAGVSVVKAIVKSCLQKSIPILSVWAFGNENWARPLAEVEFLMQLFIDALSREVHELNTQNIKLRFTGDRAQLSPALREKMSQAEALTAQNEALLFNVVINYSGKWDLVQAAQTLARQAVAGVINPDEINEASIAALLNTQQMPDPDLFIRTSGEQRLSNFFLWQLAYTELFFSELYWPDFSEAELDKALCWYAARERRYGKTSKQILEENNRV
jgi:undecaprenyl diphosphate synthase